MVHALSSQRNGARQAQLVVSDIMLCFTCHVCASASAVSDTATVYIGKNEFANNSEMTHSSSSAPAAPGAGAATAGSCPAPATSAAPAAGPK